MFAPFCPQHDSRVLLSLHDITGLRSTPLGIEVAFRCHCGYRGVWLTGLPEAVPA